MKPLRLQARTPQLRLGPRPEGKEHIRTLGEYERLLGRFETCGDGFILPDLHLVLRLDAHRYGEEWGDFDDSRYPFCKDFVGALSDTARSLMSMGTRVVLSFVHGDEISLLLHKDETSNPRRRARLVSGFASGAGVEFYKLFGRPALFHARLSELPTTEHVVDYFLWQRKVASRNFFFRTIGLKLAADGAGPKDIDQRLGRLTEEERLALAQELGVPSTPYDRFGLILVHESTRISENRTLPESDSAYYRLVKQKIESSL